MEKLAMIWDGRLVFSVLVVLMGTLCANAQQPRRTPLQASKPIPTPTPRPVQIFGPSQSGNLSESPKTSTRSALPIQARGPQARLFNAIQQANHTVITLNGDHISLNQLLSSDQPTIFIFWATYCHVCHTAFDDWQAVYDRYVRQGLNVIALNIKDPSDREEVKHFMHERRLSFPVYFAPRALHTQVTDGRMGTPMTFVFSREGNLAARLVGWTRGQGRQTLENIARDLLAD